MHCCAMLAKTCSIELRLGLQGGRKTSLAAGGAQGGSHGDALVGAELVHYSSLAPRTYLCARLLETLD